MQFAGMLANEYESWLMSMRGKAIAPHNPSPTKIHDQYSFNAIFLVEP
jgi:hypothetical protein